MLTTFSSVYAQTESITSRFYFPGMLGIDFQTSRASITYKKGLLLNTAIEYRPNDVNPLFFRFNYDGITNKYNSNATTLPTNVTDGSLHRTYLMAGAGYRKRYKSLGWYVLTQPGLSIRSYDIVKSNDAGYVLEQFTRKDVSVKFTGGFEYYVAPHFAIIMEPSHYQNSFVNHKVSFNNSEMAMSIGITTTLF
ncbi:hypothetical protein [Mucilaginibacter sp.]|uniref:hypothetical protein n=1 Tax=Mucilaginibacter sp. TaxID=1882438 RepID=UPI00260A0A6F|nr:hypothetical protein [Mucilaginibacter sp.]